MASETSWSKIFAFGCSHHPLMDPDTLKWQLSEMKSYQPDYIVNLGDWMDADAASRWPNEHQWTLKDEYRLVTEHSKKIRETCPSAKLVWLEGNHDSNLSMPNRIPVKLREVCSWKQDPELNEELEKAAWKIIPYRHDSYHRIGQITFAHGAQTNVNSDRDQCLLYGVENGLFVSAHTHRPVPITRVILPGKIPMRYHFANVGCGADWTKMEYVQRTNHALWGHAICLIRANTAQRRAWFGSRQWEPDPGIKILKMAHN